jgi:peptidoglycan-N-acetylglucosamine deacetylase
MPPVRNGKATAMDAQPSQIVSAIVLAITIFLALIYCLRLLTFALAAASARNARPRLTLDGAEQWPRISVIVAAYNEELVIEATVRTLLAGGYPELEVIVVDDGSSDATYSIAARLADADPRVVVIKQPRNMGRAEALNVGIRRATAEYLVFTDADTVPHANFLKLMIAPLLRGEADAVSGNVKAGIRRRKRLKEIFQSIEYVATLNAIRLIQNVANSVTTIPGAAGAMRKSAVQAVGEFSGQTLTEDADLTLRLGRDSFRIFYESRAIVHTEVPATWRALFFQRRRWMHGNLQCIWQHLASRQFRHSALIYGMPNFMYENIVKPPLECVRACIPLLWLGHAIEPGLMAGYGILVLLNWSIVLQAYLREGERMSEVLWAPLQYLVWPLFLIHPYVAAGWLCVTRRNISWKKDSRRGELASAVLEEAKAGDAGGAP